jgi:hypothetical protein
MAHQAMLPRARHIIGSILEMPGFLDEYRDGNPKILEPKIRITE